MIGLAFISKVINKLIKETMINALQQNTGITTCFFHADHIDQAS